MSLLACEALSIGHGPPEARQLLARNLSWSIEAGEVGRILGPSGAGKSTLLRVLCRLTEPVEGVVRLHDRPLSEYDPLRLRRRCLYVPQTPTMFAGSVRDNLSARPSWADAPDLQRGRALLDQFDVLPLFDRPAASLSVGEQQRVCLIRALLVEPEVLLLDEPTSALDADNTDRLRSFLERWIAKAPRAVVLVSHDERLAHTLVGPSLELAHHGGRTPPRSSADA